MALCFAIANAYKAHDRRADRAINRELFRELNGGGYAAWLDERDAWTPLTRADLHTTLDDIAAATVADGGGMEAVIDTTGLQTADNVLGSIDPAILELARENDDVRAGADGS